MLELTQAVMTEKAKEFSAIPYSRLTPNTNRLSATELGSGGSKRLSKCPSVTPVRYPSYTFQHLDSSLGTTSRGRS